MRRKSSRSAQAVEANDTAKVEAESAALQEATFALSSRLYQQAGSETPEGASGAAGNGFHQGTETPNEDVIDAEFKSEEKA